MTRIVLREELYINTILWMLYKMKEFVITILTSVFIEVSQEEMLKMNNLMQYYNLHKLRIEKE